jgi:N-acetylmuramic acid 6-phosphate etherase
MKRITEEPNPASRDLDLRSTEEILGLINTEDQAVPGAVREVIPMIARAVNEAVVRMRAGGRVFYIGAGTSGRLGVLDASEIPPTFGVDAELFQAVIAGGYGACHRSIEASEDDTSQGERDLRARGCRAGDVVVGIAASGETPYTLGALTWARSAGALTIALCCNPDAALLRAADIAVTPVAGPEIIAGSTRMKAGTAQKLVLNMFSTAVMVRLGHVYSHWMVNVQMKSAKLKARGLRILLEATGMPEAECRKAIASSGDDLRVALVMLTSRSGPQRARANLQAHGWNLRETLKDLAGGNSR